ncbi:MAG: hypothetical protein NT045_07780, partial [Candidatus Aureabacteria bacterium]|nr:hypothetical protein [Candidatus Auribacterota bacterium]
MICPGKSSQHRKPFLSAPVAAPTAVPWIDLSWFRADSPLQEAGAARGTVPAGRDAAPRKAARFLNAHAKSLGINNPSSLIHLRTWKSGGGTHVRFQQVVHAIPVIGALVDVHLDRGGKVCAVTGSFHRRLFLARGAGEAARMTRAEAIQAALDDLGRRARVRAPVKFYELICWMRGAHQRVYKVVVPSSRPLGTWVYLLDPFRGIVVRSYNVMRFARGRIYRTSPVEDAGLSEVALERLRAPVELKGEHVAVINEDAPEARAGDGLFIFAPEVTHFDEVMAYYHIDRIASFFGALDPSLAAAMSSSGTMHACVHAGDSMDNAYYDPATNGIYLGDGGGAA